MARSLECPHKGRNIRSSAFYIECCFHYLHLGLNALLVINHYLHLIHNRVFLRPLFSEMCIYLLMSTCVLYSEPIPLSVCALFPSLYVLMQLFRINTAFKLLELLSFKGIFMRRKKSLSLIWFKHFQRNQTAKSSLEMLSHFWSGRKLSRQKRCAAAAAAAAARCTRGWPTRTTFSNRSSHMFCVCVADKTVLASEFLHPVYQNPTLTCSLMVCLWCWCEIWLKVRMYTQLNSQAGPSLKMDAELKVVQTSKTLFGTALSLDLL